jgi:hypothetical protein
MPDVVKLHYIIPLQRKHNKQIVRRRFMVSESGDRGQGCQIFLRKTYQKYQMTAKYTKWP